MASVQVLCDCVSENCFGFAISAEIFHLKVILGHSPNKLGGEFAIRAAVEFVSKVVANPVIYPTMKFSI